MYLIGTYKSLCTEFYDLDKPTASKEALEYYLKEVKKSIQPILEPMCGTEGSLSLFCNKDLILKELMLPERCLEDVRKNVI